jgi:hypothetical protein
MNNKKDNLAPVIHLGYGKSASTSLQECVFPYIPEIYYYGKGARDESNKRIGCLSKEAVTITLKLINIEHFANFTDDEINDVNMHVKNAQDNNKVFLFSNEQFSESVAPLFQAQQMKSLFPNGKVVIVIRNQYDLLRSLYKYRGHFLEFAPEPHRGKYVSFKNFVDYAILNMKDRGGHKARDWHGDYVRIINFSNYIDRYIDVFGRSNVGVFLFEDFVNDRKTFISSMLDFMSIDSKNVNLEFGGCRENTSIPLSYIRLKKIRHYLFRNIVFAKLPLFGFIRGALIKLHQQGKQIKPTLNNDFTDEQLRELNEILSYGNKKINKTFNLNLEKYKYPMGL